MKEYMGRFVCIGLLALAGTSFCMAQDKQDKQDTQDTKPEHSTGDIGKVRVHVSPEEAYIWVDGKPVSHRSSTLKLPAGDHKIAVYNYGYQPETQDVNVTAGETKEIEARL